MTAPGNDLLVILITLGLFLSSAYAVGRIHQWRKYGFERDEAYRVGYEKASRAIMGLMADRLAGPPREAGAAQLTPRPRGRHSREHRSAAGQRPSYRHQRDERGRVSA